MPGTGMGQLAQLLQVCDVKAQGPRLAQTWGESATPSGPQEWQCCSPWAVQPQQQGQPRRKKSG